MKTQRNNFGWLGVFFLALLTCTTGWGQATGSIVGTVTDVGGAVIPSANVTYVNLATNESRSVLSDQNGNFRFLQLLPGTYKVSVQREGFQQFVQQSVEVAVGNATRVDASLQVGSATETIEVTSEAPLLSTQSSSLNYGVQSRQVQQLPLNGRNVLNLMSLVPGVVPQGNTSGNPATLNVTGWGNYQIGGGTANQAATYIDGAPINVSYVNATSLIPTQEAIQEFQVATNNVSPEYGRFAGGIVNMATKSGTNEFHGVLYEYVRNSALNANLFFNKRAKIARPIYTQNQYGTTLGGPIIKNKAFFFLSWEGLALARATTTNTTVPTAQMLTGDFSQLLAGSKPTQLYNPYDTSCGGARCPFAGNLIPSNYLDATAKVLAPLLWPAPTTTSTITTNFTKSIPSVVEYNQYMLRGDAQLNDRNKLFGRFTNWHRNDSGASNLGNTTGTHSHYGTIQSVLGDTITINQNMIGDVRASFLRFVNVTMPFTCCDFQFSTLGPNWAQFQTQSTFPELPEPNVAGMFNFNTIPTILETDNAYVLSGSVTWMKGRHTIQFGGEGRKIEWAYVQSNTSGTTFNFGTGMSSSTPPAPQKPAGGFGFASFMLGAATSGFAQEPMLSKGIMWYYGAYINDSFRMSPKLTINAGLRWEQPGSFTETHGSLTTLDMNLPQPAISAALGKTVTGGLALINSPQFNYGHWQELHWLLFSPRVGFAYSPTSKWVTRGGFGISYLPPTVAFSVGPYNAPTNMATTTMTATLDGTTPYNTLSNPFPSGLTKPPGRSQAYVNSLVGQGIQSPLKHDSYPYMMQWNIGAQRQIGNTMVVNIGYVGSRGIHLPMYSINKDQLPDQYISMGADLLTQVPNPFYGIIPASAGPLGQATVGKGYLLKPYPQYLYMTADGATVGKNAYNALQVMFEKRFKTAGVMTLSYTRSSMNGTADVLSPWVEANRYGVGGAYGVQDNNNINGNSTNPGEYSKGSFDTPDRVVFNYVLNLPFGHGQRFLHNANGVVNQLVGGWAINGISTFQSGFPMAFSNAVANNLETFFAAGNAGPGTGAGVTRPNFVQGCNPNVSGKPGTKLGKYFNTACYTAPDTWAFGNEPRVSPYLRNQGIDNTDFSAAKSIVFHDRYNLNFRAEFFNIFNWTQFAPPNTQPDAGAVFGTVTSQYNQPRLIQMSARFSF
jgi:Carboxypeptidase regulatory-like domain/TonB-dependent Receptor Plug Domain